MLRVGRITGMHGLRGALRYRPDNPGSDALAEGSRVRLATDGEGREYQVVAISPLGSGTRRLELAGINANAAEKLKGAVVLIDEAALPPSNPGEFYYYEVIGCEVFLDDGARLGTIEEVFSSGANDVWVVRGDGREVLVPVIEDVVKVVDLAARRMTITAVPGLLD
jgi:16S rRNA processing protein RimM